MKSSVYGLIWSFTVAVLFAVAAPVVAQPIKGDIDAGKTKSAVCSACHGAQGNSSNPIWPNIAGQGSGYLIKQIQDIKADVRPVPEMKGFVANLSEQDIADISAYYASLPVQITGAADIDSKDWNLTAEQYLALGEKIYRAGNAKLEIPACIACHSPTGIGNAPAKYPAIGGQHRAYLIKQLQDFRGNKRKNDGSGQLMRQSVSNLKDLELEAVANYISGLH